MSGGYRHPPRAVEEGWVGLVAAIIEATPRLSGAACIGQPPELFDAANASADDIAAAKALCARCDSFAACSQWASGQRHLVGVVAGEYHHSKRDDRDDEANGDRQTKEDSR
jgi:hypothetical protein